ncbi:MAG: preprotein translocase subunit SecE [Clostridium sp.]|jgi:preprotein translocase subunit SecE|nr:preprotein translocase subunit SecE [Clostridium sp.]
MMTKNNAKAKSAAKKNGGIIKFFKDIKGEVKRITWPKKNEVKKTFMAVAIFVLIYIVLVGGFDYIFQNLFEVILKLK